jgi:hypothetical protein
MVHSETQQTRKEDLLQGPAATIEAVFQFLSLMIMIGWWSSF